MLSLNDVKILEGVAPSEPDQYFLTVQSAINGGDAWAFQGSYGRAMMQAIQDGQCMLGRRPARDYWGSRIPSRDEVKPGTPGSYDFVVQQMGLDWADAVAEVA